MIVNRRRTKEMMIGPILKGPPPDLLLNDTAVDRVSTFKLLGVHVFNDLKWTSPKNIIAPALLEAAEASSVCRE